MKGYYSFAQNPWKRSEKELVEARKYHDKLVNRFSLFKNISFILILAFTVYHYLTSDIVALALVFIFSVLFFYSDSKEKKNSKLLLKLSSINEYEKEQWQFYVDELKYAKRAYRTIRRPITRFEFNALKTVYHIQNGYLYSAQELEDAIERRFED